MALEDLLKEMTAQMKRVADTNEKLIELRTEAIESVKGAAASTTKATKATEKATTATTTTETASTAAAPNPVHAELGQLVANYVGAATREEERDARKAKVRALLQHEKIKKPDTPADQFDTANILDEALDLFRQQIGLLIEAGDVTKPAATSLV